MFHEVVDRVRVWVSRPLLRETRNQCRPVETKLLRVASTEADPGSIENVAVRGYLFESFSKPAVVGTC